MSSLSPSQCNRSTSLQRFIESIRDPCSRFIAIMGAGCSVASEPVAEILHYWGLSQVMITFRTNTINFQQCIYSCIFLCFFKKTPLLLAYSNSRKCGTYMACRVTCMMCVNFPLIDPNLPKNCTFDCYKRNECKHRKQLSCPMNLIMTL